MVKYQVFMSIFQFRVIHAFQARINRTHPTVLTRTTANELRDSYRCYRARRRHEQRSNLKQFTLFTT
jgi:hypothetical protein